MRKGFFAHEGDVLSSRDRLSTLRHFPALWSLLSLKIDKFRLREGRPRHLIMNKKGSSMVTTD